MDDVLKKNRGGETPQETDQAVARLADRLAEMAQADGVFSERMLDEEVQNVAGGQIDSSNPGVNYCKQCGQPILYGQEFCGAACRSLWDSAHPVRLRGQQALQDPAETAKINEQLAQKFGRKGS